MPRVQYPGRWHGVLGRRRTDDIEPEPRGGVERSGQFLADATTDHRAPHKAMFPGKAVEVAKR